MLRWTPSVRASVRLPGSASPGLSRPRRTSSLMARASRMKIGCSPSRVAAVAQIERQLPAGPWSSPISRNWTFRRYQFGDIDRAMRRERFFRMARGEALALFAAAPSAHLATTTPAGGAPLLAHAVQPRRRREGRRRRSPPPPLTRRCRASLGLRRSRRSCAVDELVAARRRTAARRRGARWRAAAARAAAGYVARRRRSSNARRRATSTADGARSCKSCAPDERAAHPRGAVAARPRRRSARHRARPRRQPRHADAGVLAHDAAGDAPLRARRARRRRRRRPARARVLERHATRARASPAPSPARTAFVGARVDGKLVACARAIADGHKYAWVYDVVVAPQWRGCGLGAGGDAAVPRPSARARRRPRAPADARRPAALSQARFHRGGRSASPTVSQYGYAAHPEVNHGAHALHRQLLASAPMPSPSYVALEEKGVPYTWKTVSLPDKAHHRPEYLGPSMTGRVPAIDHDGFWLAESARHRQLPRRRVPRAAVSSARCRRTSRSARGRAWSCDWIRSDLMPIREERPTHMMFFKRADRAAVSAAGAGRGDAPRRDAVAPGPRRRARRCSAPGRRPTATSPSCCSGSSSTVTTCRPSCARSSTRSGRARRCRSGSRTTARPTSTTRLTCYKIKLRIAELVAEVAAALGVRVGRARAARAGRTPAAARSGSPSARACPVNRPSTTRGR